MAGGRAPVVVLGMGRSGTTLVVELLERMGVFMGVRQDVNREALLFQNANRAILAELGVALDRPEDLPDLHADDLLREQIAAIAAESVNGPALARYLGWPRYLRTRSLDALHEPWGWKDPRNTLTFSAWKETFGEVRAVHVLRHGVDAAASYRRVHPEPDTAQPTRGLFLSHGIWRGRPIRMPGRRSGWAGEVTRFGDISTGVRVWADYTQRAFGIVDGLGDGGLNLRFEDLLADPEGQARRLAELCGVPPIGGGDVARRDRAFAFRSDPELIEVADRHRAELESCGYGPGGPLSA